MATTIVSASTNPTTVIVANAGATGLPGTDGVDGAGFNDVSYTKINNPLCRIFKFNEPASLLVDQIEFSRNSAESYTDIYGDSVIANNDVLRLEADGYLFGVNDVVKIQAFGNVPNLINDWALSVKLVPSQVDFCLLDTNNLRVSVDPNGFVSVNGVTSAATYGASESLIISASGTDTLIYLDGVLADTISVTYVNDVQGDVRMFARLDESRHLLGNVQDFKFYDSALNEFEALYMRAN